MFGELTVKDKEYLDDRFTNGVEQKINAFRSDYKLDHQTQGKFLIGILSVSAFSSLISIIILIMTLKSGGRNKRRR